MHAKSSLFVHRELLVVPSSFFYELRNMAEDNLSRQVDEIEALAAIYADDWKVIDSVNRSYCISINDEGSERTLSLQISLPDAYPGSSPPIYSLNAPWLRGKSKQDLGNELEEIYCENIGESIIHLWVEHIRGFLENLQHNLSQSAADIEEEGIDGEEFDPSSIQAQLAGQGKMDVMPDDLCLPEIHHGETVHDRKSVFQGHIATVHHQGQVDMVLDSLKENKKIASATHNIVAYRIKSEINGRPTYAMGCEDDGEFHAGSRMLHLMQIVDAENVVVVVTRWYGGIHLGPDRFKHINNCTRKLMEEHGFIKAKEKKTKGGKSSKR
ncbi:hypothetical protein CAPTEDRAFT_222178 [Capitella teleta]|uniref:RWD domain-containing protein n=1 Tax=Capitella teleta TaxID=283909 RepID=X2ASX8_CAPTE|nr:hypothetical protein CAPTEDRAFT_222178 [Capitella teleta]|eukprot:ELT88438.1 hypothetical protein CAPTEDRAFT_222178 [Capitella teleta]